MLDAALATWITPRSAREIYDTMQARRVPFAIVATPGDLLESEHLRVRESFDSLDIGDTRVRVPGLPFRMQAAPARLPRRAPEIGQHNGLIFGGRLSLSPTEIAALSATGVI